MANLVAKSAFSVDLPLAEDGCRLTALELPAITSVAIANGQTKPVATALNAAGAPRFPAANRFTTKGDAMCIWSGPDQAFLIGTAVANLKGASLTDQSDGWAAVQLEGPACEDVLASLVPIDLRSQVFKTGHTARTRLFHCPLSISRTGASKFMLLVFRSMATTAVSEIHEAMISVAAQSRLV